MWGAEMARRNEAILEEIRNAGYEGPVVNGMDLDVFLGKQTISAFEIRRGD